MNLENFFAELKRRNVYVCGDDKDKALAALETLVRLPGYLAFIYLLRGPMWVSVRGAPGLKNIVKSMTPKTAAL